MPNTVRDEVNNSFTHFHHYTIEVWVWSNFIPPLYHGCDYLSMLGLIIIHVTKRGPRCAVFLRFLKTENINKWRKLGFEIFISSIKYSNSESFAARIFIPIAFQKVTYKLQGFLENYPTLYLQRHENVDILKHEINSMPPKTGKGGYTWSMGYQ